MNANSTRHLNTVEHLNMVIWVSYIQVLLHYQKLCIVPIKRFKKLLGVKKLVTNFDLVPQGLVDWTTPKNMTSFI